jgi:cysteine-rich repeat protein
MRLLATPWLLTLAALGALLASPVGGCAGAGSTGVAVSSGGSGGAPSSGGSGAHGGSVSSSGSSGSGSGGSGGAKPAVCGDGIVNGSEECDLGPKNGVAGSGCDSSCFFACIAGNAMRDLCDDGDPCNGVETCGTDHACHAGTPPPVGSTCGTGKYCVADNCVLPSCGDGVVEPPEECDLAGQNGAPGSGCTKGCSFPCVSTDPTRDCVSTNACVGNGTCDGATHLCAAGAPVANGTACGTGMTCQSGTCVVASCAGVAKCTACNTAGMNGLCNGLGGCNASICGDGCVDPGVGEQCDPPNGTTCSATCQVIAVCGNGALEAGEQCDDGNLFDLDGCDSKCKYEVIARMTAVSFQGIPAPSFCTPTTNRLGTQSITSTALGQLNMPLQQEVTAGVVNVFTQFLGLGDLTGVAATNVTVGLLDGLPDPARGGWPAAGNPLDWWFLADSASVSQGLPTSSLTGGTVVARALAAGPNDVTLTLLLGGSPSVLSMHSARIAATLDGNPAPNAPPPPPTTLAAGLTVFQTMTGSGANQGLCGNITVASLAKIPVPAALAVGGGTTACGACPASQTYTSCGTGNPVGPGCNSLLDVLVGGCQVVACLLVAVNPLQPDVPAGSLVQVLTVDPTTHKVTQNTAADEDAYSAYLKFDANRVHFTGETCAVTTDCQVGKTCSGGICQ